MTGSTTTSGVKRSNTTNQGILVVGNLHETPTNPSRERKPRRASLAASAKWNVLKNKNSHNNSTIHHPTSPSSNATSGRQSGISGGNTKQLSPASLSTGTISLDGSGTEAGSLVRIPNCHSDGSNTSGVDSVVEKSNNNNNNNNVIINSEKMMKTTTTMLGNDKNDVNNTQNEMNNTNKP